MGKGGEADQRTSSADKEKAMKEFKLSTMPTEKLKEWVAAFGLPVVDDRLELLSTLNPYADGILDPYRPPNMVLKPLPFTFSQIKEAIPEHCFKRNFFTSMHHVCVDLVTIAIFFILGTFITHPMVPNWARFILWPIYWYAQGAAFTGIWVMAHEAGHQAFSESEFANNTMGSILHSLLLVPYHSWRITHRNHHSNTGSCDNDEVFVPFTKSDWGNEMLREAPIAQAWGIFLMLVVGWPGYLLINATGPPKYRGKPANHFDPNAVFFKKDEYWLIVQSDICFFMALGLVIYSCLKFGMCLNCVFFVC